MTTTSDSDKRIGRVLQALEALGCYNASVSNIGPNGPEVFGLENNWPAAKAVLEATQDADIIGVFQNFETGHQIDFHWGWTTDDPKEKGQGLAKLRKWHPNVVESLHQIVDKAVVVAEVTASRKILSDGRHVVIISENHNNLVKRWLVTAFHTGKKPSKKDRTLLKIARDKISQATNRTVDGDSIAGQTNATIAGANSTDRLVVGTVPDLALKINDNRE